MKRKPPTMADVARRVGVSPMTVSRALRNTGTTAEATRIRILQAAEELGYVVDVTASGFSSGKSGFVAMTIPSINNSNFAETVRGVTNTLRPHGLELLLGYTDYDFLKEEELIAAFLKRRPQAVILTGGTHSEKCRNYLENAAVPVIEVWELPKKPLGHVVGFDNRMAGKIIAQHFYEVGYRRPGFVGGIVGRDVRGSERADGFFEELAHLGLPTDRLISDEEPPIAMREGANAIVKLLDRWPDTDAVMCVSDAAAFGALSACQSKGLRVPQDIAIAGFGAFDLTEYTSPQITTISVGALEIGAAAGEVIVSQLDDAKTSAEMANYVPRLELLVRGSTLQD